MTHRPIQYFSQEYLKRCQELTPDQILQFLEEFQKLMLASPEKCKLISLKIEPTLLKAFQTKAKLSGVAYQTQIKQLMRDWLTKE